MGNTCSTKVVDIIPDKDVMLNIVDKIILFESMLKQGQDLTLKQLQEKKKLDKICKSINKYK